MSGRLMAVGLGPGGREHLTPWAAEALAAAEVVVGYTAYCEQVRDLIAGKRVIATGMRAEVERCRRALDEATQGAVVAVISSGDPGIYGMAGLLLELIAERGLDLEVEVIPGVTAATAAAARLGAPLSNDFCVISLSDLLTPRESILRRLRAVAEADLVCVLYNPRSTKRHDLFDEARVLFTTARGGAVPVGLVRNATRTDEWVWTGPLADVPVTAVDMSTVVVIGNSATVLCNGRMITKRGYRTEH